MNAPRLRVFTGNHKVVVMSAQNVEPAQSTVAMSACYKPVVFNPFHIKGGPSFIQNLSHGPWLKFLNLTCLNHALSLSDTKRNNILLLLDKILSTISCCLANVDQMCAPLAQVITIFRHSLIVSSLDFLKNEVAQFNNNFTLESVNWNQIDPYIL